MQSLPTALARKIFDAAPEAIVIIDDSGEIRFVNKRAAVLFGYSRDELFNRPVDHLIPQRLHSQRLSLRRAYIKKTQMRKMGARLKLIGLRSDGTEFPIDISLSPIHHGGRTLVAAVIRDVTDHMRVEANLGDQIEDMRRLHEMSARLLESADLRTMLREVLDATIALQRADFGSIQLRDSETDTLRIVAHHGFSDECLEHFASVGVNDTSASGRALRMGERVIIENVEKDVGYLPHRAIAAHEQYRAVQCTPIRGRAGALMGICSTQFRLPHRPSDRELQLTDLYMRLVAELVTRLQDEDAVRVAGALANRANQAKSRFLATASHDLRQPLHTLALLNGTLRRISMHAAADEALAHQEQAIGVMSRLLNALLDISKLESGAIKPEPTDFALGALFEELRQEFAGFASSKSLTFEVTSCEDPVHSDPSLVGQILRNLIANAIKYTRAGRVTLRCLHDELSCVRIEVVDTGVGIPAEQLRYIYDEFFQVGVPSNTTREGYGLGLSIVQHLVTLLDLKLDVESEVGKGSKFILRLPTRREIERPVAALSLETDTAREPIRGSRSIGGRRTGSAEPDKTFDECRPSASGGCHNSEGLGTS